MKSLLFKYLSTWRQNLSGLSLVENSRDLLLGPALQLHALNIVQLTRHILSKYGIGIPPLHLLLGCFLYADHHSSQYVLFARFGASSLS